MFALLRHPPENCSFGMIWESGRLYCKDFRKGLRFSLPLALSGQGGITRFIRTLPNIQ